MSTPPGFIYLDYNATTPVAPAVFEAMRPHLAGGGGNPSSTHAAGRAARAAIDRARAEVADFIDADPGEIVFTGSGTESNNTVIFGAGSRSQADPTRPRGVAGGRVSAGPEPDGTTAVSLVTSAIEHPAILEPCAERARRGDRVTLVGVDSEGRIRVPELEAALSSPIALVSVMTAQNEIGTIQPIASIARLAHAAGALVHTDAAQAIGKIAVSVRALEVDYLSIAGHKLYAPKGIGALFVRRGVPFRPLLLGAGHEAGRRAGTENVAGIVGLGAACVLAKARLGQAASVAALRDRLWDRLARAIADCRLHGAGAERLPNTLSMGFGGADARTILGELSETVAVSAGAACHGDGAPSGVLAAMGVPAHYARGTVRFSLGYETTEDEIDRAAGLVVAAVGRARA